MSYQIKVGDTFPNQTIKILTDNGIEDIETSALLQNKKVMLFAVPGAFTPTCSAKHLPGYILHADEFFSKGIDMIICMSVNDPFVMRAWGEHSEIHQKIVMLPDGNAALTKALGLEMDATGFGMGTRAQRFAMYIDNAVVQDVQIEENGTFEVSKAEYMLARL